jgi:hypothetical protein
MSKYLLFSFTLLALAGCQYTGKKNAEISLAGTWQLYDIEPVKEVSGGVSFTELASLKQVVQQGYLFSFFEDGRYTELKGADVYKAGKYQYRKEDGWLQFEGEKGAPLKANTGSGKNGKEVLSLQNDQQHLTLRFIREGGRGSDFRESPFHPSNNLWRVKPAQSETESQQLARLANYIKHVALILKVAKESKQAVVSFEYSQGPIKIYNGGIGIHPYEIVPQSWKNSFYKEEEAKAAYSLYEAYLRKSSYRGGGTGDWVEDDYNILQSIYAGLVGAKE